MYTLFSMMGVRRDEHKLCNMCIFFISLTRPILSLISDVTLRERWLFKYAYLFLFSKKIVFRKIVTVDNLNTRQRLIFINGGWCI